MRFSLIAMGKTKQPHVKDGLLFYRKRISRYFPFEIIELPDTKTSKKTRQKQIDAEGESLLNKVPKQALIVTLDEHGKEFGSKEFAKFIQQKMNQSVSGIAFLVGGAYGHSDKVKQKANFSISLSKMTFPHDLVRLLFSEQLYRAMTIIRGEPYHHE